MRFKIAKVIATFCSIGKMKFCPGTWGSIATLPVWVFFNVLVVNLFKPQSDAVFIWCWCWLVTTLYIAGHWATGVYLAETKTEDPGEVVIDEVVGQLLSFIITLLCFSFTGSDSSGWQMQYPVLFSVIALIFPIILFRIFDIKKPWLVGMADSRIHGAFGVMLDDIIAGVFAGLVNCCIVAMAYWLL